MIDGRDELHLSPAGATWKHLNNRWAKNVELNGVKWEPRLHKTLENSGATRFLAEGASLANATLTVDKGRGSVKLEKDDQGEAIVLLFEDFPIGAATYELTVRLGDPEEDAPKVGDEESAPVHSAHNYETVKLADGTKIQVEKMGETFEAYDYAPPMDLDDRRKIQLIVDYATLWPGRHQGINSLQIDVERGKLYWTDWIFTHHLGHVVQANVDGSGVKDLASGLSEPRNLVLDKGHSRLYWLDGTKKDDEVLNTSDVDGNNSKTLISGLNRAQGLTLDPRRGVLYYWDEQHRIIRVKTDGSGEELVINGHQNVGHSVVMMQWNSQDERLYWSAVDAIRRARP